MNVGLGYSLETFFADSPVPHRDRIQLSGLRGEVLSFQVICRSDRQGEVEPGCLRNAGGVGYGAPD